MKISIVTSLYNSSSFVYQFYNQHKSILNECKVDYEFIFVDDGSTDDSISVVKEICNQDEKVKLVILSRNFGQYNAIKAGLYEAKLDHVYVCDADMEDDPCHLKLMIEKIKNQEVDVVFSTFSHRTGGFVRAKLGGAFYWFLAALTDENIEPNQSWQRLMTRPYVNSLLKFEEFTSFPGGAMHLTGFNQVSIPTERKYKGSTSYNFSKRLSLAVNAIIAFSSKPLVWITSFGFCVVSLSVMASLYVLLNKLFGGDIQVGWSSVVLSIWFFSGVIISILGIIGLYIVQIFRQVRNRPAYVIKEIYDRR